MATVNTNRPSNVRQEISVFMGGAGGIPCEPIRGAQVTIWQGNQIEIFPTSRTATAVDVIAIHTCGWASPGSLPVIVTYPDGTTRNLTTQVGRSSDGGLETYTSIDLGRNPPLGNYQVKFDGRSRNMYANFRVIQPSGPRLYTLYNGDVMLWNFRQNERVTLYAYQWATTDTGGATFVAYQEFLTDSNGSLYVDVNLRNANVFVAVGSRSGQVIDHTPFAPIVIDRVQ